MKLKTMALATSLAFVATASQAVVLIDDFSDPLGTLASPAQVVESFGVVDTDIATGLTGVLGGSRELSVICDSGCVPPTAAGASLAVFGGALHWSNDSGVRSTASSLWNASGVGLNFNLLGAGSTITATVVDADDGFNYQIELGTFSGGSTKLVTGSIFEVNTPLASNYAVEWFGYVDGFYFLDDLPFNIENTGGGVTLTDVDWMKLTLSSTGACYIESLPGPVQSCDINIDLKIDDIRVVPEPSSMALAGLGLLGLAGLRRRKQV